MNALVFDIEKFAVRDGPGIRTVVFLKGCPLRCPWCHNPESREFGNELFFHASKCTLCGNCLRTCPNGCHSIENGVHRFDRTNCVRCMKCAEECYSSALEPVAKMRSADEVLAEVLEDRDFFGSDGGLTVSGGEPMAQFEFMLELCRKAKTAGIRIAVETCGYASFESIEALLPVVDLWLWDVKATGSERHRKLTGVSNKRILDNLRRLDTKGGKIILRCPLVPGINDDAEHLQGIAALANSLRNVLRIEVEPYHPLGEDKNRRLGKTVSFTAPFVTEKKTAEYLSFLRSRTSILVGEG